MPAANVVFIDIDPQTGLLASPNCPTTISEAFIAGTEPQEYCSWHERAATTSRCAWTPAVAAVG